MTEKRTLLHVNTIESQYTLEASELQLFFVFFEKVAGALHLDAAQQVYYKNDETILMKFTLLNKVVIKVFINQSLQQTKIVVCERKKEQDKEIKNVTDMYVGLDGNSLRILANGSQYIIDPNGDHKEHPTFNSSSNAASELFNNSDPAKQLAQLLAAGVITEASDFTEQTKQAFPNEINPAVKATDKPHILEIIAQISAKGMSEKSRADGMWHLPKPQDILGFKHRTNA